MRENINNSEIKFQIINMFSSNQEASGHRLSEAKGTRFGERESPILRIQDVRRATTCSEDLIFSEEDAGDKLFNLIDFFRKELAKEEFGSRPAKKSKGRRLAMGEAAEKRNSSLEEVHRIGGEVEFLVLVREEGKGGGRAGSRQVREEGMSVWVEELEELVEGTW